MWDTVDAAWEAYRKQIAVAVRQKRRYVHVCGHLQVLAPCPGHKYCMNQ